MTLAHSTYHTNTPNVSKSECILPAIHNYFQGQAKKRCHTHFSTVCMFSLCKCLDKPTSGVKTWTVGPWPLGTMYIGAYLTSTVSATLASPLFLITTQFQRAAISPDHIYKNTLARTSH